MEPSFPGHARKAERAKLVGDFTTAAAVVVATMNFEDTSVVVAKGLRLYLVPFNKENVAICLQKMLSFRFILLLHVFLQ